MIKIFAILVLSLTLISAHSMAQEQPQGSDRAPAAIPDDGAPAAIPDELLDDEHVREEFGINEFTAPSINKIFTLLKRFRPLPYEETKRIIPKDPAPDRNTVAITLGFLIADGFFAVEGEQFLDLEPVGLSLLKHAKAIGAGERIKAHTKSILDHQNLKDWDSLKASLSKTQKDIEREMVSIRDVDLAHLIALGGWLRALEIGCAASLDPYDAEKAKLIAQPVIVEYFASNLEFMVERIPDNQSVKKIAAALKDIQEMVNPSEEGVLDEPQIRALQAKISPLMDELYGKKANP